MANQALSNQIDLTYASDNNWRVIIEKIPNTSFFCIDTSIPTVSLDSPVAAFPSNDFAIPGDKLTWDDLELGFIIDEGWFNYCEVFDWMNDFVRLRDTGSSKIAYSDATLMILDNLKNPVMNINFASAYPIRLQSVKVTTASSKTLFGVATFRYNYFETIRMVDLSSPQPPPQPAISI